MNKIKFLAAILAVVLVAAGSAFRPMSSANPSYKFISKTLVDANTKWEYVVQDAGLLDDASIEYTCPTGSKACNLTYDLVTNASTIQAKTNVTDNVHTATNAQIRFKVPVASTQPVLGTQSFIYTVTML